MTPLVGPGRGSTAPTASCPVAPWSPPGHPGAAPVLSTRLSPSHPRDNRDARVPLDSAEPAGRRAARDRNRPARPTTLHHTRRYGFPYETKCPTDAGSTLAVGRDPYSAIHRVLSGPNQLDQK